MTVVILNKGTEDIFYEHCDIIVDYFLIYETEQDDVHVRRTCAFAYSPSEETYFDMNTGKTESIQTVAEANEIDIAYYSADIDNECRLSSLMEIDGDFFVEWMKCRDIRYPWITKSE